MMSTRTRLVALAAAWAIYVQVSDPNGSRRSTDSTRSAVDYEDRCAFGRCGLSATTFSRIVSARSLVGVRRHFDLFFLVRSVSFDG
jgi:hypothetical protein